MDRKSKISINKNKKKTKNTFEIFSNSVANPVATMASLYSLKRQRDKTFDNKMGSFNSPPEQGSFYFFIFYLFIFILHYFV